MPQSPQIDNPNVLTLDYADNPDLKSIFAVKDVGQKCTITIVAQVMSKDTDKVVLAIEKIKSTGYLGEDGKEKEVKPEPDHPVMATVRKKGSGMMGPHNRPPEEVQNSTEPSLTSYA